MTGSLTLRFIDPVTDEVDAATSWLRDEWTGTPGAGASRTLVRSDGQAPEASQGHRFLVVESGPTVRSGVVEPFGVRDRQGPWTYRQLGGQRGVSTPEAPHLVIAFTSAVDGQDDGLNEWYDTIHLGEGLSMTGFESAQRYRLDGPGPHRYLAVYEATGPVTDLWDQITTYPFTPTGTVDFSTNVTTIYTVLGGRGHLLDPAA